MRAIQLIILSVILLVVTADYCTDRKSMVYNHEYRVQLHIDTTFIYCDGALIGTVPRWKKGPIENIIWFGYK
jgi:hypothetical protein